MNTRVLRRGVLPASVSCAPVRNGPSLNCHLGPVRIPSCAVFLPRLLPYCAYCAFFLPVGQAYAGVCWVLSDTPLDIETELALGFLDYLLLGTPAAPLRKVGTR